MVLVLFGALSKSAIVPMHFWLPGAMAAPTPVSAYLHAAAMVKAGVYLVARMTPASPTSPWRPMVVSLGVLTVLLAGWRAVREYDLKLILAFGTVSQLGLITVMVGAGGGDLMLAGLAMLCAHAMFKAALFMVVGVIDHTTGTRDIRRLAWLGQRSRPLLLIAIGATASMAALPPFLGFVAKEADFETLAQRVAGRRGALRAGRHRARLGVHHHLQPAVPVGCVRAKGRPSPSTGRGDAPPAYIPGRPGDPGGGPGVRAVAGRLDAVLDSYADTVPGGEDYELALWHGLGLPLLLSVLVLAVGTAAFFFRTRCAASGGYLPLGNADRIYDAVVHGADVLSWRLTGPPSAARSRRRSRWCCARWCWCRWWCWRWAPAIGRSSRCGTRRCRWWSGC